MKTVLLTLEFPPAVGGVENYYGQLSNTWPAELIVVDNSEHKLLKPRAFGLKWLPTIKTIITLIKQTQPDWFLIGEVLPLGTAAWLTSYLFNFKFAVFLHGLDFSLATQTSWKKFITRKILNQAKLVICANSYTADLVIKFLGKNHKVRIANPGIKTEAPLVRSELLASLKNNYLVEGNKVLLTIGRLVKRKGVADVLTVLPEILQAVPNLTYVIIGNGPEETKFRQLMADPNLSGKVFLFTNTSEEEKWAWLKLCDIFVMPTKEIKGDYEGFGIVYLEANLFNKPVIATKSGGVGDAVINEVNGLLVEPNQPLALEQAIIKLATDEELCFKLGHQGKERAINSFAWPKISQQIFNYLKAIN